jgi:P27 family predicted phage terminase small subunit
MGQRGPSPKPTALRILQGNPGKLKLNPHEPHPAAAAPELPPPAWLSPKAGKVWTRLRPDLPWLSVVDVDVLAAYCWTFARWREAEDFLAAEGLTVQIWETVGEGKQERSKLKFIQQRPEVAIAQKSLTMLVKLGGELGLSPASRTRIQVEPEKPATDKPADRMFG